MHVEQLVIEDKDALQDELETFLDCVRNRRKPPVSADDGVAAIRLATAIVDSLKGHRWDGTDSGRIGLEADIVARGAAGGSA